MKYVVLIITAFASFACNVQQQANSASKTEIYRSNAIIKNIDIENSLVTLDHDDIPGYMSAMEMTFNVIDRDMLYSLNVGDIVEFDLERNGSEHLVINLAKKGVDRKIMASNIYKLNCAECHGNKGEGGVKGIPFTSGHALHHTETEFIRSVTEGKNLKKEKHMPAFRQKLNAEQIDAVVKFIREDIQKGLDNLAARGDSHSH